MTTIMFLIGFLIFIFFIAGQIWEVKTESHKNYYERHSFERKKNPKTRKGSQSRVKNYNNKWK
jgi:uncharacterized protein YxeA